MGLSCLTKRLGRAVFANDIRARLKAETWALRDRHHAVLRNDGIAVELFFEVEITPLHHCTGTTKGRVCMYCGKKTRAVVKGMNPDSGVVGVRHRGHLAQFCQSTHFGRAGLNEIDRLRFEKMLEIHYRRGILARGDRNASFRPDPSKP